MQQALDILNEIADRLGWAQIDTLDTSLQSTRARKLTRVLNRVLKTWGGMNDWPLLRAEGSLVLVAAETGSATLLQYVTATQNSDIVTVDNMTFDDTYKERAFNVTGNDVVYRIAEVLSPTQIKLNRAWIADSITAADETLWTIAQDRYALPDDFDRPSQDLESFLDPYKIKPLSPNRFKDERRRWDGIHTDSPRFYTIFGTNPGETVQLIRFEPYPSTARMLMIDYQRSHPAINSDNDKIFVQDRFVEPLIDFVMQLATRDYEDDDKDQKILGDMLRTYNEQASNQPLTAQMMQMRPANTPRADYRKASRRSMARIDYGDKWDTF